MEFLLNLPGWASLVMIALIVVGWMKFSDLLHRAFNQQVLQRDGHRRGTRVTRSSLQWSSPNLSVDSLAKALRRGIVVTGSDNDLGGAVCVVADFPEGESHMFVHAARSLKREQWRTGLVVDPNPEGGCVGRFEVLNWLTVDGVIPMARDLDELRGDVRTAVSHADPASTFSEHAVQSDS